MYAETFFRERILGEKTRRSLKDFSALPIDFSFSFETCMYRNQKVLELLQGGIYYKCRSSHWRCSVRKVVLRNFAKFTGKELCQSLFFNKVKVSGLQI